MKTCINNICKVFGFSVRKKYICFTSTPVQQVSSPVRSLVVRDVVGRLEDVVGRLDDGVTGLGFTVEGLGVAV